MGTYIDDERQSPRPPGPRPAGLAANAPSAASQQLKGPTDPVFAGASCIWGLCGQSILIFRCDRALAGHGVKELFFHDFPSFTVYRAASSIVTRFPAIGPFFGAWSNVKPTIKRSRVATVL